jgi:hypothetical protein
MTPRLLVNNAGMEAVIVSQAESFRNNGDDSFAKPKDGLLAHRKGS